MVEYSPEEVAFFKSTDSPYITSRNDNFDKYSLFIERSLSLLANSGRLGIIVPHKFMITTAGASVRQLLTKTGLLEGLVHFGAQQVFGRDTSNYTCIISVAKNSTSEVDVEQVRDLNRCQIIVVGS